MAPLPRLLKAPFSSENRSTTPRAPQPTMTALASCSSTSLCTMPSTVSSPQLACTASTPKPTFALAKIKGDVCLVQVPHDSPAHGCMSSALMAADVHVFRHEFITLFRYSHRATVHPADMHILEPIADHATLYEEDKGTVFLARDVMTKLQKLTMDSRRLAMHGMGVGRYHRPRQSSSMSMSRPIHSPTRGVWS